MLVTCSETTKAVESTAMLAEKEANLQMALKSADLGTWYMNVNTREFIPSARLKEMFGFASGEEMPYDAAITQIADTHRQQVLQAVEAALSEGKAYDLEYPITGYHDKLTRWVRATGSVFNDDEGKPVHFSGTVADITIRKKEDQRKQDFIGIVSHELKSPLTSLSGYLQIMKLKASELDDKVFADLTARAKSQTEKMNKLISGFLDVARLEESKLKLDLTLFDMADLSKAAESETSVSFTTHRLTYHPVEFTPVEADWDKIEQVIINLINNAAKYSPVGSAINIACITRNGYAHLSVSDEGIGVAYENQDQIFSRFYRVESADTQRISGFGIGLYICKEIIEQHKGCIGVNSEIGRGSTFWFELPIAVSYNP